VHYERTAVCRARVADRPPDDIGAQSDAVAGLCLNKLAVVPGAYVVAELVRRAEDALPRWYGGIGRAFRGGEAGIECQVVDNSPLE